MKDIVIVGTGDFADFILDIVDATGMTVAGYALDGKYLKESTYRDLPVKPIEEIEKWFPQEKYGMVIGFIGQKMYTQRYEKYQLLKEKGYDFPNLIHPSVFMSPYSQMGDGNIIFQQSIFAFGSTIGNCNIFTNKSNISHHVKVGNANYFAPGVSTTGYAEIGNYCFLGVNSAINNKVKVADYTFVGGGKFITDNTHEYDVFVPEKSVPLKRLRSIDFQMFTSRRNQEK